MRIFLALVNILSEDARITPRPECHELLVYLAGRVPQRWKCLRNIMYLENWKLPTKSFIGAGSAGRNCVET